MPLSKCFPCFQFRLEEVINKLDYSNNILSEAFPQVWEHERTLEELNVTSTRINYLPPQLFYCHGLKVLLANNNNIETIPDAIGALRQLQQLNLSRNFISSVPDNIKSCKHLSHLDLSCNTLQRLPDALTSLISLEELILNETYLEFLPANFGRLVNLRIVELRSNNLISLPKSMQRLTNLQRLDIGGNEFTKMPEVIGELKQLREFWFDFNQIRGVPVEMGKLRELRHCEANGNFINFFPNEISNWRNLEVLSVSTNNLSTFPFSIGMLKSLVTFKCESNELTELPDSISNLENLEELVVSHNRLIRLPNTIGMLRKLRYLFADNNDLLQLPDEICSCSSLTVLSVSCNKISELPNNIGHLTKLKVLNIVQNHIATLPVTLLSLVNLTSLWISNNQSQPLIPLQYSDVTEKTRLTCFMLPQLGSKQYTAAAQAATEDDISLVSTINSKTHQKPVNAPSNIPSTRRICFAEETTILNTTNPTSNNSSNKINNNNINQTNTSSSSSSSSSSAKINSGLLTKTTATPIPTSYEAAALLRDGIKLVPVASKDFLMRSPTPYPKELRLMAKHAERNNYHRSLNNQANDNTSSDHNTDFINSNNPTISSNEHQQQHSYNSNRSSISKIWHNDTSSLGLQQFQTADVSPSGGGGGGAQNYYENNDNTQLFGVPITYEEYYQDVIQNQYMLHDEGQLTISSLTPTSQQQQQFIIPNSSSSDPLKPPPYHIARCFTKKTVEDLTNYEVIRKQQRQQHQLPQHSIDNIDNLDLNMDLNNDNNQANYAIMQVYERSELDEQNNLMNQQQQHLQHQHQQHQQHQLQLLASEHQNGKAAITQQKANNNDNVTALEHPQVNKVPVPKSNKSRAPWLFGVHRNPTVKQVSIKVENRLDFEIDVLPNMEGIYIVSTVPDSSTSRLLCPYDKLLEVDGIDFTNISINEARQVLNSTGPLLNIMLSRK